MTVVTFFGEESGQIDDVVFEGWSEWKRPMIDSKDFWM